MITVALRIGTKETILGEKRESISLWLFAADTSLHTEQPHDAEFRLCRLLSCTREQHCWEQSPLLRCRDRTLMLNWCQRQLIAFVDTDCCLYFLPSTTKGTQVQSEFHLLITYFPCSLLTQDVARACHRNFQFYCSFLREKYTHPRWISYALQWGSGGKMETSILLLPCLWLFPMAELPRGGGCAVGVLPQSCTCSSLHIRLSISHKADISYF